MTETIAGRVRNIIAEHLNVDLERVTDDVALIDDLNADDLDLVELAMAFEEEFNIEIPDDDAEQALTVGDAIKTVERIVTNKQGAAA
jgi:acyl carrier protein